MGSPSVIKKLRKVLVKGRVGHGKSTLAKKIAYDWAKGLFKRFSIVFFISMKLVKPGDSIENMIIDQNGLGDLNFTAQKIKGILDKFGSDCLVIIDGLGDHTLKNNEEVLRIVQKEKVNFNFLVTLSETNFPDNIDEYFETISQVQGFNGSDIKSVVAKLGDNHREVSLKWIQSLPETFSDLKQRNPMLILLLSFLVSHDPSTELGQTLSIFTVYARTVLRLLGSVDFESQRNLVKDVGRIAFDVLQTGKVYTKAEVSDSKILVKGLLVESKTSLVSFAHSSLQIFFASLHFVLKLDQGLSIETLLGKNCLKPIFMINSLFLYFCLSLLGENPFVNLRYIKIIRLELKKYILGRINSAQLDINSIAKVYPALDMSMANMKKDRLSLPFFLELLSACKNVQDLILTPCPGTPVEKILSAIKDQCKSLQSIRLLDDNEEIHVNITNEFCPDDLSVVIHNQSGQCVDELLEFLQTIERSPCIYFVGGNKSKPMIDMSLFPTNTRKHAFPHLPYCKRRHSTVGQFNTPHHPRFQALCQ